MIGPSNVPSANQHHEDQICRPLYAEDRLRLDEQGVGYGQRSGGAATEAGQHKQDKLQPPDPDTKGSCCLFVVANGLERNAGAVTQQQEEEQKQQDREAERQPVCECRTGFAGVDVQAAQRDTGATAESLVHCDQQGDRLGDHPRTDGELAATQLQYEKGQDSG